MTGKSGEYPPHASEEDQPLFDLARRAGIPADWRQCTRQSMKAIADQHGIELATALLCDAIRNCSDQIGFIQEMESSSAPRIDEIPTVILIPGAFHRNHKHTGADGAIVIRIAQALGWPVEFVNVRSFGSLETNSAIIIEHLCQSTAKRLLIVSLSKGSADLAMAFRHPQAAQAFSRVCGWVSLSGIATGTMLVPWLRSHRLRTIGVHLLLWMRGQRFRTVDQMRGDGDGQLCGPIELPGHIRATHVMGFPLRRHLRHSLAPRGYERISSHGPTDGGGVLLADAARLPGLVYPVWGVDHYLNPAWDVVPLIRNILLHAAKSQTTPSTRPAARSTA